MSDELNLLEKAQLINTSAETELILQKTRREEAEANKAVDHWRMSESSAYDTRTLTLGPVTSKSADAAIAALGQWAHQDRDLEERPEWTIRIDSPGGEALAGFSLIDYIHKLQYDGYVINTEGYGMVASMGATILQVGNTRRIGKNCFMLIHEVSGGANGSIGEIADASKFIIAVNQHVRDILESRSNLSKAAFTRNWNRKDWWLEASKAIELGFADEFIEAYDHAG